MSIIRERLTISKEEGEFFNTRVLFFDEVRDVLNALYVYHPIFFNLFEKALADFWTWNVVDFSGDKVGWLSLNEDDQRMFILNNGYQTLMDSGVVDIYAILGILGGNSELRLLYNYISQNESIHSVSYSKGLDMMLGAEAKEAFDVIYEDEAVKSRLKNETNLTLELFDVAVKKGETGQKAREALFRALFATYVLEQVKFPFSFFVTWRVNSRNNNALQGFSGLIKRIAHDELTTHVPTNRAVLKILKKDEVQGFLEAWDEDFTRDYVYQVVEEEIAWAGYLLQDKELSGINVETAIHFIRYHADLALKQIGVKPLYQEEGSSVIEWFNRYRRIDDHHLSIQERKSLSYQKGVTLNDVTRFQEE